MKIRIVLLALSLMLAAQAESQTQIDKSFSVKPGQTLSLHFDYPQLVRITTWDRAEVRVTGTVSINAGENDDAFILANTVSGNVATVTGEIPDLKKLPHRITITRGGQKIVFKTQEEYKKYVDQSGRDFSQMSDGVDLEIRLEISVPRNLETRLVSVYGMVEVRNFGAPLRVEATYGGVDAAVSEKSTGTLTAETNYGQIYTNLTTKLGGDAQQQGDFHTLVSARPGSGPNLSFESKYGNVYLRKSLPE